ncbi:ATP-binding cassette domain-containing protein [Agromyces protaetiae]|uniref:ATP-binding cassette domain-containing protein n=1 Tax=Agromyces protaetiae TaxID=2509455 RepID=UPI001FB5D8CF|nr:ABC transporter ATP-binding protein [Agromyces protaetiae]
MTFRVAAGEQVALVGASGAGKSTIGSLVLGSLAPTAGRVRIGGVDSTDGSSESSAAPTLPTVGLAGQDPHVFAGPLAADLRLAKPDATDADLREALAAVGALDWAERLPDGIETVVGSGGHALTIVESQELALARLVLLDPAVLVLDEATASAGVALDSAVARVAAGRTSIQIAHRLDQAARADRIVVLDRGRVVEQGAHDVLVAAGGAYAALWTAWSANRSDTAG